MCCFGNSPLDQGSTTSEKHLSKMGEVVVHAGYRWTKNWSTLLANSKILLLLAFLVVAAILFSLRSERVLFFPIHFSRPLVLEFHQYIPSPLHFFLWTTREVSPFTELFLYRICYFGPSADFNFKVQCCFHSASSRPEMDCHFLNSQATAVEGKPP